MFHDSMHNPFNLSLIHLNVAHSVIRKPDLSVPQISQIGGVGIGSTDITPTDLMKGGYDDPKDFLLVGFTTKGSYIACGYR